MEIVSVYYGKECVRYAVVNQSGIFLAWLAMPWLIIIKIEIALNVLFRSIAKSKLLTR